MEIMELWNIAITCLIVQCSNMNCFDTETSVTT